MQRFKVNGVEGGPRDHLTGDFRSLGSSGVFEALPGSRYGSSVDLTETGVARPRPLPRALQPKTAKDPQQQQQQQRSASYRLPVVALPPTGVPATRGLGNHGDRSLGNRWHGNQNFGSQVLLASKPTSTRNQSPMARGNSESTFFGHVTSGTPGTAQANAQTQRIERMLNGGGYQPRGEAERENRTAQSNNNGDVGYRSVPLSNFRNRRNSSSDLDPMWKSSAPNAYVTRSTATISLAKPRSTRYGSLFDLSKDCGPTTEGGGRQTGSDVIGHGLFPGSSSGIRTNGTSGLSKEPEEEPVFDSSSFSSFSSFSNASESRNTDTSGSGGHVTGNTWNRGFDAAGRSSSDAPVTVLKRLENWNKTEKKATTSDVTSVAAPTNDDHLTHGNEKSSTLGNFRSRKFSFDHQILPQKADDDFRSYSTFRGPAMTSSIGGGPQGWPQPMGPAPWAARVSGPEPGPFRERSHSTTLNRCPRGGGSSSGGDVDPSTALLALRSSRYPSAQMTDDWEGTSTTMSASERVASSPWAARASALSDSGEKNRGLNHHHHHNNHHQPHQHQSLDQWGLSTKPPVQNRLESSVSSNFDDVIDRCQYSSVSCAPVTSEAIVHSTAPPAHDVMKYSAAQSHIASSSCDVRGEDSFVIPASEKSFAHRLKESSNLDLGNMAEMKSSSPVPLPSYTWKSPRRNSLPVVVLERKDDTTKTRAGGGGGGRGGGNYESIFSKGDWINAARMTWKSPSRTESPVAGKPASSSSTDGPGNFQFVWKTPPGSESSSASKMTSAFPVKKSETFERSEEVGEKLQNSRNSEYLHESGANSRSDPYTISREKTTSGIPEWSDAIFREKSTTKGEESSAYNDGGEAISKSDPKTTDWMKSQKNTESTEDTRGHHLGQPNPVRDNQIMPEENFQSEISAIRSTKSSDLTENDIISTSLTSEPSDVTLNLHDTSMIVNRRVESDAGSRSPVTREPTTRTKHANWKEWYYGGLERTTTDAADQWYCATQVSDHESGYQSSGPTLDDLLPPQKPGTADRKSVHREEKMIHPEDPDSAGIFQNGCNNSGAENKDSFSFISADRSSPVAEKTPGNGDEGKRKCDVPESSGSGGNPRELVVHVRASPLGVGFSIEGGQGSTSGDRPITVKRIFTGGDHLSDKLKPGDAIVRVNDKDFTRMTHYEAWNYLKTLPEGPASFLVHTN